jgi:6-phosphogluconolactonase
MSLKISNRKRNFSIVGLEHLKCRSWNEKWDLIIPGDKETTIDVCARHFVAVCRQSIQEHGNFFAALSGGSTPKALFEKISQPPYKEQIVWENLWLLWSDERSVPPDDAESNYRTAMEAGLGKMPIPKDQIFRMKAEEQIEENALEYENLLKNLLKGRPLDLVMLGMGEDGHTASLFPQTEGLKAEGRLVIANYVPQKNTWRMTLTYEAINAAQNIAIYVLGASKKEMVKEVLTGEENFDRYPIQKIGTMGKKALWILDEEASSLI